MSHFCSKLAFIRYGHFDLLISDLFGLIMLFEHGFNHLVFLVSLDLGVLVEKVFEKLEHLMALKVMNFFIFFFCCFEILNAF